MKPHVNVNSQYCTGCRTCELVCSCRNTGDSVNPKLSRIRVSVERLQNENRPKVCRQCEEMHCLSACPAEAIVLDETLRIPVIDKDRCIGCKLCIKACPHSGIFFDEKNKKAMKCDLCSGDPQCVKDCWMKALSFEKF